MAEITVAEALNLGVEKHRNGKLREAEAIYREILRQVPDNADALHLLGLVEHQSGRHEDAAELILRAIKKDPNQSAFYGNLGMVYDSLGNEEESSKYFLKALEFDKKYSMAYLAHYNLGVFFKERGQIEEALKHFTESIKLKEDFAEAHWNRALILLLLGNFKEGWKDYEYRFKKKDPTDSRIFHKPEWTGNSLDGKKILILSEQGYGDNTNFARYLPMIREKGGKIILECKKELKELFENSFDIDKIVIKGEAINEDYDCYIHMMSLPQVFETDMNSIPDKIPYLKANPILVEEFREKIREGELKIGICWAGNPEQENNKNRSTTSEYFKDLKKINGVKLYSLQKGEAEKELDDSEIINLADELDDFSKTAAAIENLDLIISVDTSVAHLAGAMGKPVWTLLSFIPDWRWLLGRKDCLWYPSMKLFRQKKSGDWDSVFEEVEKELNEIAYKR